MKLCLASSSLVLLFASVGCGDDSSNATAPSASLVEVGSEAPGKNCEHGGSLIRTGADADGDGALGDGEEVEVSYVCNAATSPLVKVTALASGEECEAGGSRIAIGIDNDDSGELEDAEVTSTQNVCNIKGLAAADLTALVETVTELEGENCAMGGTKITSGIDEDDDGKLDGSEVDQTSYACAPANPKVIEGAVYIYSSVDIAALEGVEEIKGSLLFQNIYLPETINLPALKKVSGQLTLGAGNGGTVATLSAPLLESVGSVNISSNKGLTSLSLPKLTTVSGSMQFSGNSDLTTLDLPELALVDGILVFNGNASLAQCELDALAASITVKGEIIMDANDTVATCQ